MYTSATEWPRRADQATYEKYAKLPAWHIEEAASLAAGFVPRPRLHLNFRPLDDEPAGSPPYNGAQTWAQLLDPETGCVGRVMVSFARAVAVQDPTCGPSDTHVAPSTFLEFCDKYRVPTPADLRAAVQHDVERNTAVGPNAEAEPEALKQPEARYRAFALPVAREIKEIGARNVTAPILKSCIENRFVPDDRTVLDRTFQTYLDNWRSPDAQDQVLRVLLAEIMVESGGRPRKEDVSERNRRLRGRFPNIALSDEQSQRENTKTAKTT
jgi:hypothetical protein